MIIFAFVAVFLVIGYIFRPSHLETWTTKEFVADLVGVLALFVIFFALLFYIAVCY